MTVKDVAVEFLRLAASGETREAYALVTAGFRHHNPYFPGDADSLARGMAENARQFPDKTFEIQRVIGEADLVAVHSRVRMAPDMPAIAVVHIFRFEGNRIAELWDVGQPSPADSPNQHGMF